MESSIQARLRARLEKSPESRALAFYGEGDELSWLTFEQFIRGDSDGNGVFEGIPDGLHLLAYGFIGGPPPPCLEAADANGDGILCALFDGLYILTHSSQSGPPPPAPYRSCGIDPDLSGSLGCDVSTCP